MIFGYDLDNGAQLQVIKDWQGVTIRDVVALLNATGKALPAQVSGHDIQLLVDAGSLVVFTTMLH